MLCGFFHSIANKTFWKSHQPVIPFGELDSFWLVSYYPSKENLEFLGELLSATSVYIVATSLKSKPKCDMQIFSLITGISPPTSKCLTKTISWTPKKIILCRVDILPQDFPSTSPPNSIPPQRKFLYFYLDLHFPNKAKLKTNLFYSQAPISFSTQVLFHATYEFSSYQSHPHQNCLKRLSREPTPTKIAQKGSQGKV